MLSSEFGVSMMDVQMCCRLRLSGASEKLAGTLTNRCLDFRSKTPVSSLVKRVGAMMHLVK